MRRASCPRAARAIAFIAGLAASGAVPARADIVIERVVSRGERSLVAWVGATAEDGSPVRRVPLSSVSASVDTRELAVKRCDPGPTVAPKRDFIFVLDPDLLAGTRRVPSLLAMRAAALALAPGDRVRVCIADGAGTTKSFGAGDADHSLEALPTPASATGLRLYDACFDAVRTAAHVSRDTRVLVQVWTLGRTEGGKHAPVDVLTLLRGVDHSVTIDVLQFGTAPSPSVMKALVLLSQDTGGRVEQVEGPDHLPGIVTASVARMDGRFRMGLESSQALGQDTVHRLRVGLLVGDESMVAERAFSVASTRSMTVWSWFGPWVGSLAAAAIVVLVWLLLTRRRLALLVFSSGDNSGEWLEIFRLPVTLGFETRNDVVLDDSTVSNFHATLERGRDGVEIVDLNSTNGTFVNDRPVGRQRLADGDQVRLGESTVMVFEASS